MDAEGVTVQKSRRRSGWRYQDRKLRQQETRWGERRGGREGGIFSRGGLLRNKREVLCHLRLFQVCHRDASLTCCNQGGMITSQHGVKGGRGIKNYAPACSLEGLGVGRGGALVLLGDNKFNGELYLRGGGFMGGKIEESLSSPFLSTFPCVISAEGMKTQHPRRT